LRCSHRLIARHSKLLHEIGQLDLASHELGNIGVDGDNTAVSREPSHVRLPDRLLDLCPGLMPFALKVAPD
jgi:hypothetical protein